MSGRVVVLVGPGESAARHMTLHSDNSIYLVGLGVNPHGPRGGHCGVYVSGRTIFRKLGSVAGKACTAIAYAINHARQRLGPSVEFELEFVWEAMNREESYRFNVRKIDHSEIPDPLQGDQTCNLN